MQLVKKTEDGQQIPLRGRRGNARGETPGNENSIAGDVRLHWMVLMLVVRMTRRNIRIFRLSSLCVRDRTDSVGLHQKHAIRNLSSSFFW